MDAAKDGPVEPKLEAVAEPPVVSPDVKKELQAMAAKPPFTETPDGGLTIVLEFPVDVSNYGIVLPRTEQNPSGLLTEITLRRAIWKRCRAAARRYPANPTPLDQDAALIAELSGMPEHVIDELDGRDMSVIQMALGKLLYSQRILFET